LVIEDEPLIRRICVQALLSEGFEVDVAENGLIAVEMASLKAYDLFVSDMRTPAMDGIQFYKYLSKNAPNLALRVIFTTGDVLSPYVSSFLGTHRCTCLPKPFIPDDLRAIVKKTFQTLTQVPVSQPIRVLSRADIDMLLSNLTHLTSAGSIDISNASRD
jgi:DNA-binding NtrC family response regulator